MDDEEILKQFRCSGDKTQLEELIRRHFDQVYRFVASMIGNREVVDDLVQDVLMNVIRNIDGFRGEATFSTWIYRIASNRVYRYIEMARKTPSIGDMKQVETVPAKERTTPESREMRRQLDQAINELSPALRAAMLLTTVEGLTPEEAADVEGCTAANIHWRVHKARKILKERLRKHWEE